MKGEPGLQGPAGPPGPPGPPGVCLSCGGDSSEKNENILRKRSVPIGGFEDAFADSSNRQILGNDFSGVQGPTGPARRLIISRGRPGIIGPTGPKGSPGPPGPKGESGNCLEDMEAVARRVCQAMIEENEAKIKDPGVSFAVMLEKFYQDQAASSSLISSTNKGDESEDRTNRKTFISAMIKGEKGEPGKDGKCSVECPSTKSNRPKLSPPVRTP